MCCLTVYNVVMVYYFFTQAQFTPVSSPICETTEPPPPYTQPVTATKKPTVAKLKAAKILVRSCQRISSGPPAVYKLTTRDKREDKKLLIASCQIGENNANSLGCAHKVLMVVGATGCGKSTLINALSNYFLGVEFNDPFRFQLITPEDEGGRQQTHSQTSWVKAYKFMHPSKNGVPYRLTIVDTPGYGDTRGIEQDKLITAQIKEFFSSKDFGVDHINGVAFVVKASDVRLTPTQQYIFREVLNIFGCNIQGSIMIVATHADTKDIPVLAALKEAKVPINDNLIFAVNNCSLYALNQGDDDDDDDDDQVLQDQLVWKKNEKAYEKICRSLQEIEDKSLWLTKKNLEERETLQLTLEDIKLKMEQGMKLAVAIRQTKAKVLSTRAERDKHKDFVYDVPVQKKEKQLYQKQEERSFNCTVCEKSCHSDCTLAYNKLRRFCKVVNTIKGTCKQCDCLASVHKLENFVYTTVVVQEKRVVAEGAFKFAKAHIEVSASAIVLEALQEEQKRITTENLLLLWKAKQCLKKIQDISLSGTPITETSYVDLMIQNEKETQKDGWKERVEALNELKQNAEAISEIGDVDEDILKEQLKKMIV